MALQRNSCLFANIADENLVNGIVNVTTTDAIAVTDELTLGLSANLNTYNTKIWQSLNGTGTKNIDISFNDATGITLGFAGLFWVEGPVDTRVNCVFYPNDDWTGTPIVSFADQEVYHQDGGRDEYQGAFLEHTPHHAYFFTINATTGSVTTYALVKSVRFAVSTVSGANAKGYFRARWAVISPHLGTLTLQLRWDRQLQSANFGGIRNLAQTGFDEVGRGYTRRMLSIAAQNRSSVRQERVLVMQAGARGGQNPLIVIPRHEFDTSWATEAGVYRMAEGARIRPMNKVEDSAGENSYDIDFRFRELL